MLVFIFNTGYRCNRCDDGYYDSRAASHDAADAGDEKDEDVVRECVRCRCNNNIDHNAVGNCDRSVAWQLPILVCFIYHISSHALSWPPWQLISHQPYQRRVFISCFRGRSNILRGHVNHSLVINISCISLIRSPRCRNNVSITSYDDRFTAVQLHCRFHTNTVDDLWFDITSVFLSLKPWSRVRRDGNVSLQSLVQ